MRSFDTADGWQRLQHCLTVIPPAPPTSGRTQQNQPAAALDRQAAPRWSPPARKPIVPWMIRLRGREVSVDSGYLACSLKLAVCQGMCSNVVLVITLGIILLIVGFLIHSPILWAIGILLLVIGAILALLGALGRAVFGRRHYW
jgi:hypothetical protein